MGWTIVLALMLVLWQTGMANVNMLLAAIALVVWVLAVHLERWLWAKAEASADRRVARTMRNQNASEGESP